MQQNRAIWRKLWGLAAALAVCATYANSFRNPFEFDDFHTIVDNPAIRSLRNVPRFFTDASTFSVLPANRTYRPMVSTSLALDYALGHRYNPFWFHLDTLVWFLLLLYLLWMLYAHTMNATEPSPANIWLALFAATWFGLHPAMAETVNYIIQRGDLYCSLGCVAALVIYVRAPRLRKFGIYLLPLVTALLSKPPAAVFPALLLSYVFFFETDGLSVAARWRKALFACVPSLIVTAALLTLQSAMTPKSFAPSILDAAAYRLVQPLVWLRYFGALFLPLHLNIDSDLGPMTSITALGLAGILFVVLLIAAIGWSAQQKRSYPIAYGLLWFVFTQLPTSLYPLSEVENDHRMFFSFIGLILAVVWAGRLLYERAISAELRAPLRPALAACAVLMLSGYARGTYVRNAVWHSPESVWHDDVLKSPHNGRGLMNYGLALMERGDYPDALEYFTRALEFTPNYPTLEINLGIVNGVMNRKDIAEAHFKRAISLAPQDDTTHAFYGQWLNENHRSEAIAELRTAVALNPSRQMQQDALREALSHSEPSVASVTPQTAADYINQSLALCQQKKFNECLTAASTASQLDQNSAEAWNNIAAANEGLHRWDAAIIAARKAIALKPDFQLAKNNLSWSLSQKAAAK